MIQVSVQHLFWCCERSRYQCCKIDCQMDSGSTHRCKRIQFRIWQSWRYRFQNLCIAYSHAMLSHPQRIHPESWRFQQWDVDCPGLECTLFRSSCLIILPFCPPSGITSGVTWPKFGLIWTKNEVPPPITIFEAYLNRSKKWSKKKSTLLA